MRLDAKLAHSLNQSGLGLGFAKNYGSVYEPFLAFSEPGVEGKFQPAVLLNKVGMRHKAEGGKFTLFHVLEQAGKCAQMNVGTGYNMASVSALLAALSRFKLVKVYRQFNKTDAGSPERTSAKQKFINTLDELDTSIQGAGVCWFPCYEDAALCGLTEAGMELYKLLNDIRKLSMPNPNGGNAYGYTECLMLLQNSIKQVSGVEFPFPVVAHVLKCYRIARGISGMERFSGKDAEDIAAKVSKNLNLTPEEMDMVAIAGAFRRCGQGRFGNNVDAVSEGSEDGQGVSLWTFLSARWDKVKDQIPQWLRRKLYKAMTLQLELAQVLRDVAATDPEEDAGFGKKKQAGNARSIVLKNGDRQTLFVTPSASADNLPAVCIENCGLDNKAYGVTVNGEFQTYTQLHGAFEHQVYSCPVKGKDETPDIIHNTPKGEVIKTWIDTLSAKDILKRAAERYPLGLLLYSKGEGKHAVDIEVFLHFQSIMSTAAFFTGGATTGFTLNLVTLLVAISGHMGTRPTGWDTQARNTLSGIQGLMREMLREGLLRRIGRPDALAVGSKVLTSHSPKVANTIVKHIKEVKRTTDENGKLHIEIVYETFSLPTFIMNPNDDLVRLTGVKEGEIVSIFRTPMIAKIYGVLKFDESVSVGHIEVHALIWSAGNHGDGDGDPIGKQRDGYIASDDEGECVIVRLLGQIGSDDDYEEDEEEV